MVQWLNLVGWVACVIYSSIPSFWLLIHPRAEYWRSRKRSPYGVLVPAWFGIWIIEGVITYRWRDVALYSAGWTWIPAMALFTTGFWLYSQSHKNFSAKQLGGLPEVVAGHREQQLVITGIRARVRHPVYLGHLCEMLAWSLGTGWLVCYGLTAFAVITGAIMIGMEETELEQRFGAAYAAYRERVPAVFPKLRRRLPT